MTIRELTSDDLDPLAAFFAAQSERDLTFIREDAHDRAKYDHSLREADQPRFIAIDGDVIIGYSAVERLSGWSRHVGELRLVVDPTRRGGGIGRVLAQKALSAAVNAGVRKVVVELAVEQQNAISMFSGLGFTGEALLRDHIRDGDGQLHDLVVLAHLVEESWSTLDAVGLADAIMP
jgi:L-amino acid N-acyltransferase YncA